MRIKISAKLYSISGLAIFGLGLVTIMSAYVINRQNNAVEQMAQGDVAQINNALGAKISLAEAVRACKNYLIRKDWKQVAILREQLDKLEKQLSHFEKIADRDQERREAAKALDELGKYRGLIDQLVKVRSIDNDVAHVDATLA